MGSLRERIGYWQSVLTLDEPEDQLTALSVYRHLMDDNPLSGDGNRFTSVVAESAAEWAVGHQLPDPKKVEVTSYQKGDGWPTRYWAVYVDGELLAVVLYRKGAEAVADLVLDLAYSPPRALRVAEE